jgi:hypothetical protein
MISRLIIITALFLTTAVYAWNPDPPDPVERDYETCDDEVDEIIDDYHKAVEACLQDVAELTDIAEIKAEMLKCPKDAEEAL